MSDEQFIRVIDDEGKVVNEGALEGISEEDMFRMYRFMVLTKVWDAPRACGGLVVVANGGTIDRAPRVLVRNRDGVAVLVRLALPPFALKVDTALGQVLAGAFPVRHAVHVDQHV